ncbi:Lecithin:cholesterol acyltransferase [Coccomyxa subellipsoidea C-169]|uniref:Lecithin:cholesterol acyltransferase n=1 Tax=Coccomyxa subellipsoidea (strain C-169) TaxID=574566 RepID=I0YU33_COCSC|nr:Lecithin:cholesterol acyltransferase [Coccomyxa subellipsoidea C-169]EIE21902.1 Lecithin:cholesterol acyltransferase [Coccomyxa subellipsoidea C-169]|eukprot:XP_005646446.1 Lecithin:cholesterol acyltransferase [Coccomyxa subellipsoidea C-169]
MAPRPGRELAKKGWKPKHPIIIVPGFVTSGLELWSGKPCAARYFRQRIWGSLSMTQSFMGDKACWLEHMALDNTTGLDPEGVRLRASEGLLGVDYFFPGYAVWAKLIEAAADMGYDTNNLIGETYDWRLSVPNMEARDNYFTRLKWRLELSLKTEGEKAVVASHSWGDNVFRNFMVWIGEDDPDWVEKHVAAYVNIAGPVLGVAKSMTSLLSGETRDTAELGLIGAFLSDNLVPRNERVKLFRTWGSAMGMLPVGGPDIWGNTTWAPDDTLEMTKQNVVKKHDVDSAVKILLKNGGPLFHDHVVKWGAVHADERSCKASKGSPEEYYYNPLKCPLPKAPSMQIYCLYGVGLPTERSYYYLNLESDKAMRKSEEESETHQQYEVRWKMDKDASGERHGGTISYGVRTSDGDGTVPLISTGVMCHKHWREKQLNPAGIRVVSREYLHEPVAAYKDLRGGPRSADHVDILGHMDVLEDILTIASGHGDDLQDKIISDVKRIADNIKLDVGCD